MNKEALSKKLEIILNNCIKNYPCLNFGQWEIMKDLEKIILNDEDFRFNLIKTLKSSIPPPSGWTLSPLYQKASNWVDEEDIFWVWNEKTTADFYQFFCEFLTFTPNPENGVSFYECLYNLFYKNQSAITLFCTDTGLKWTRKFVESRGVFMDSSASWSEGQEKNWKQYMGSIAWERFKCPEGGYKSFNDFFTRDLAKAAYILPSDEGQFISPCDGIVNIINENLNPNSLLNTKYDTSLNVNNLLYECKYAGIFTGGTATSTVLLPTDYHHIHAPVSGTILEAKVVDQSSGVTFGMGGHFERFLNGGNVGGYKTNYGVFGIYHRCYLIIETKNHGIIALVVIGLDDVNSIVFEDLINNDDHIENNKIVKNIRELPTGTEIKSGQKLAHFQYGGSTVITLFQPGVYNSISVKQGCAIGKLGIRSSP